MAADQERVDRVLFGRSRCIEDFSYVPMRCFLGEAIPCELLLFSLSKRPQTVPKSIQTGGARGAPPLLMGLWAARGRLDTENHRKHNRGFLVEALNRNI